MGMLEDMSIAIRDLSCVKFKVFLTHFTTALLLNCSFRGCRRGTGDSEVENVSWDYFW